MIVGYILIGLSALAILGAIIIVLANPSAFDRFLSRFIPRHKLNKDDGTADRSDW